jgi:hypothetical protein
MHLMNVQKKYSNKERVEYIELLSSIYNALFQSNRLLNVTTPSAGITSTPCHSNGSLWYRQSSCDVLQEELYKIPLETVQNVYEFIPRTAAVLKAKVVQHHTNKEMCTVSVGFPLFCLTPVAFMI